MGNSDAGGGCGENGGKVPEGLTTLSLYLFRFHSLHVPARLSGSSMVRRGGPEARIHAFGPGRGLAVDVSSW